MDHRTLFVICAIAAFIILTFVYFKLNSKPYPKNLFYVINEPSDIAKIFPKTPRELQKRVQLAMHDAQEQINAIIAIPDAQRTYANTIEPFDIIGSRSDLVIIARSTNMMNLLSTDAVMRGMAQTMIQEIEKFITEQLSNNPSLYKAINAYVTQKAPADDLSDKQKYYLHEIIADFKRNGLDLPEEKQKEVRSLKNEISALGLQFEVNISKDGNKTIAVSRDELNGLPDDYINSLKKTADNKYLIGVDYPTYSRVMESCSVPATRKKLWEVFNNRAYPANEKILKAMIQKRQQLASLLGYENYAALNIDDTMAEKTTTVEHFLDDLIGKVATKELQEFSMLTKKLPSGVQFTPDGKIYPWDFAYLKEQFNLTVLQLDEQKIAEYFPMEQTVDGLMKVYETFFDLEFTKLPAQGLWSDDLTILRIADRANDSLIGYMILDLYPRDGKFSHACHDALISAIKIPEQEDRPAVDIIIANFPKSTPQHPSLLKRAEVGTFFHELGHALHSLLGRQEIGAFSGTSVKFDFLEVPSQMFEEWLFDPEVLRMVSSHYQTGNSLPDDIIKKIIANKSLLAGSFVQRLSFQSMLSLRYYQSVIENPQDVYKQLYTSICPHIAFTPDDHTYASFGHLPDYASRYYTYLWSKVISLDLAEAIKKEGFLNPATGKRLRETILAEGGSQKPELLVRNFLGRDFNNNAFLKDIGL